MEETGTRVREGMEGGEWRVGSGDAWGDVVSCGVRKSSGCLMGEKGKVLSELMQRSDGGGWDVVKEEWWVVRSGVMCWVGEQVLGERVLVWWFAGGGGEGVESE
jgi:hypothetical protein